jgi:hypothetical protein
MVEHTTAVTGQQRIPEYKHTLLQLPLQCHDQQDTD